ncbi:MAG TPA: hypothetical protein VMF87_24915 [Streptosporangiaceae bacterium]|jgi:hypothetical protein|nr:hypothetical protein [Streptosporangiaceae bacterium]
MGVMLSLDEHGPAKGRRRQGQHARHPGLPVRVQAVAAIRRSEAPSTGRLLSRLTRTVLARRNPPAPDAGASAPGPRAREWSLYPGLSVACLLGECRDESGRPVCDAGRCEHDCHREAAGDGSAPAAGAESAA